MNEVNDKYKRNRKRVLNWITVLILIYVLIGKELNLDFFWSRTGIFAPYFIYGLIGIIHYYQGKTPKLSKDDVFTVLFTLACEIGLVIYVLVQ